jgi:hypothetical protein
MNIGILSYHSAYNFGANLQVLSTYEYLKKTGFTPIVINWVPYDFENRYNNNTSKEQANAHKQFINDYFKLSDICRNAKEIAACIEKFNIQGVVIGSDSLFNIQKSSFNYRKLKSIKPTTDHTFPNPFWGEFLKFIDVPIAGLSISSQNANYLSFGKEKNLIKKHIQYFSHLSVRDDWTQNMIKYFTDSSICPPITPDPVFCIDKNMPLKITKEEILRRFNLPKNYILLSFTGGIRDSLNTRWVREFVQLSKNNNIGCAQLPRTSGGQDLGLEYNINRPLSPIDWYYLIKYSKGYVGVLMHPIVVALHNCVPFFSFDHYGIRNGISIDKTSSKTYHIVRKSGFLNNYFSLDYFKKKPTASSVFEAIKNFDNDRCKEFSLIQEKECIDNMNRIINSFKLPNMIVR